MGWISLFLALRSLSLALFKEGTLFHYLAAAFFLLLSFFLPFHYDPIIMMIAAFGIGVSFWITYLDLSSRWLTIFKGAFFSLFFIFSGTNLLLSGLSRLNEEKPIVHLSLTGKRMKKWVAWKNPDTTLHEGWVDTHEVVLETPDGKQIGHYYIYGDYVALRAHVLRFSPWLNFFGLPNVCFLESVYNGYQDMERHNRSPHIGFSLPLPTSLWEPVWKKFFFHSWKTRLIESASLESKYFSLPHKPEKFVLLISKDGLLARKP
jgi:hypothetical protein